MTVPLYVVAVATVTVAVVTALATYATSRYLHWRSRARQLHAALEGCSNDLMDATRRLERMKRQTVGLHLPGGAPPNNVRRLHTPGS